MNEQTVTPPPLNSIAALRRFARPRSAQERCDLCAAELSEEHDHLIEPATGKLQCACGPCAVLFSGAQNGKFRRVPKRIECWSDFQLADEQWESLGVPIALAFFFRSTQAQQVVAMYPSPGGATEAKLPEEAWQMLAQNNPRLSKIEPDIEALLINRMNGKREYYRMPIDQC
ncbi:MAG TPA: DUF5947 family protein, partial [Tepidisphaeraceae bacterium]|nr:DUF5947 family protein [Tepidisphaeraceae bacterium]